MLQRIEIHQIALIDKAEVSFTPGLNVLTGETGAGKSILIDALNLVLGVRADRDLIKADSPKAVVEATFVDGAGACDEILRSLGLEKEEAIILSRELFASGRNVCRINGTLVNNASLRLVSARLIDIHGQHEHQSLFNPALHIDLLDAFGGQALLKAKEAMQADLAALRECTRALSEFGAEGGERERRLDLLRYQQREIDEANLEVGEEEQLVRQRELINNAQRIAQAFMQAEHLLYADDSGALNSLRAVGHELRTIAPLDLAYEALSAQFDEVFYSIEVVADEVRAQADALSFDPEQAEAIGARLDQIQTLKRKYGADIDAVLTFAQNITEEIDRLTNAEARIRALGAQRTTLIKRLYDRCIALHELREEAAQRFEGRITKELEDLGMGRVRFAVSFAPIAAQAEIDAQHFHPNGLDRVEFLLSANPGQPLRPLARIASGGEASRIMLALKNIFAQIDGIECLIFDEIDSGISGQMAHVVAQKMASIARNRQVLCITHLAQLASMADSHYLIEKHGDRHTTATTVRYLDDELRAQEIARLLGGEGEGGHGLMHAREMIARANAFKGNAPA
jgi:DNA repair protein RecN (Recombination protein N)